MTGTVASAQLETVPVASVARPGDRPQRSMRRVPFVLGVVFVLFLAGCTEPLRETVVFTHARSATGDVLPLAHDFLFAEGVALSGLQFDRHTPDDWLPVPSTTFTTPPGKPLPLRDHPWFLRLRVTPTGARVAHLGEVDESRGYWEGLWALDAMAGPDALIPGDALPGAHVTAAIVRTDASGETVQTLYAGPVVDLGCITEDGASPNVFVPNASFESDPLQWTSADGHASLMKRDATQSFAGGHALATGPGYPYNAIVAEVTATEPPAGKMLGMQVWAKAYEAETCRLFVVVDGKKIYSAYHPGNGSWCRLMVTAPIPEGFTGNAITLGLSHQGKPQKACYFDAVSAELTDGPTS